MAEESTDRKMEDFKGLEFRDPLVIAEVFGIITKELGK